MATQDAIVRALLDYVAGRGPEPTWLAGWEQHPGAGRQLFNAVRSSRRDFREGIADPARSLEALQSVFGGLLGQAYGGPGDISLPTYPTPLGSPVLPPGSYESLTGETAYTTPYAPNAIADYAGAPYGAPVGGAPPTTPAATQLTTEQQSARASLNSTLSQIGLQALGEKLWQEYLKGVPMEQIMIDMRATQEWKDRFPGMAPLIAKGRAISEAEYINQERTYDMILKEARVDTFFSTRELYGKWIGGSVSPKEVEDRIYKEYVPIAHEYATNPDNATVLQQMHQLYGVTADSGALLAYVMNEERALDVLQQQTRAARIGQQAFNTGFGQLSTAEAQSLASQGIDPAQSQDVFANLASLSEALNLQPGETAGAITRQDQLDATFGADAGAQARIKRRQQEKAGEFAGSSDFARGRSGVSGLAPQQV